MLPVVSDAVLKSIVQFYDYDQNIPIEARIIAKQKLSECNVV